MFFTKVGFFLASAGFILGSLKLAMNIFIVTQDAPEAFIERYGPLNFDLVIYVIFYSVALGVLVEISRSLRKREA